MKSWKQTTDESKKRWEVNAEFWDRRMGDDGNLHTIDLVFPDTENYLNVIENEKILDIACGNGSFSRHLAKMGCKVTAFDYSENMINSAINRSRDLSITYKVMDATSYDDLISLGKNSFDKAVCNMAIHDISDIEPMFCAVYDLLKTGGVFVFSVIHLCFKTSKSQRVIEITESKEGYLNIEAVKIYKYSTPESYEGVAIIGIPTEHIYYHRPISQLARTAVASGFSIWGISEPVFSEGRTDKPVWNEIPAVIIFKLILHFANKNQ